MGNHGTGSYQSRFEKGWQRPSRFKAIHPPFRTPYFWTAWRAYSEQVGRNRQQGGKWGEMHLR